MFNVHECFNLNLRGQDTILLGGEGKGGGKGCGGRKRRGGGKGGGGVADTSGYSLKFYWGGGGGGGVEGGVVTSLFHASDGCLWTTASTSIIYNLKV